MLNENIKAIRKSKGLSQQKNYSLVAYLVMCNHSNSFCNLIGIRKSLLGVGL